MIQTSARAAACLGLLLASLPQAATAQDTDFGDDTSQWAKDGECDDSRFEGPGMTDTILLEGDIGHDATDCRIASEQGRLWLKGSRPDAAYDGETSDAAVEAADVMIAVPNEPARVFPGIDVPIASIDFGSNAGEWINDGECDDVRFTGEAMASGLVVDSIGKDASDCKKAFEAGKLQLNAFYADPSDDSPIDYGDNTAPFPNDGECDDIRFTGEYSASVIYLTDDIGRDAADCRAAMQSGAATWQGKTATPNYGMLSL